MTEYRDVLERELERLSPPHIPIDRLARRRDRKRRNQRIGAAVVGIAVSLLAIGGLIRAVGGDERTGGRPTPFPTVEGTREPGDFSLVDVSSGRARPLPTSISSLWEAGSFEVSPDGRSLAFDARVSSDGFHQIFVSDVDGSTIRQVTDDVRTDARNPSWSPDGTRLVYEGRTYPADGEINDTYDELVVLNVETGAERPVRLDLGLDRVPYFDMHTPSFGPDGLTIIYTDFDPLRDSVDLRSIPIGGGRSTILKRGAAFGATSPDGQTIAFRRADMTPGIETAVSLMTPDGTGLLPAPPGGFLAGILLEVDGATVPSWSPNGRRVAYMDPATNLPPRHISVFDLDTGRVTRLGRGTQAAWLDDDTLIVEHYQGLRD